MTTTTAGTETTAPIDAVANFNTFMAEPPAPRSSSHPYATPPSDLAENFRHSGWAPFRKIVAAALASTPGISPRRLAAFKFCGSDAYVEERMIGYTGTANEYRIKATKCHDRFCVPCSQERSMRIRDALLRHMYQRENMSLITLTLQHTDAELSPTLDRITAAFKKLRNLPLWKKAVIGGASIIETKVGEADGHWHVHYHVLAETRFMDQKKLSAAWHQVTGDSFIVDIRRVGAKSGAIQYITKYVTKAADASIVTSPKHLAESIVAFTGRRLVATFGEWRGLQLMERAPDEESCSQALDDAPTTTAWRCVGSLDEIIRRAAAGSPEALAIMLRIAPRKFRPDPDHPAPP